MHKHKAGALDGWLGAGMGYPRLSFESGLIYVRVKELRLGWQFAKPWLAKTL
jgi:hypothetical protein